MNKEKRSLYTKRKNSKKYFSQRFSRLIVLEFEGLHYYPCGESIAKLKCKCDCGNEVTVLTKNLLNGNTRSCGCIVISKCKNTTNLIGTRFSRLLVIHRISNPKVAYICRCDCGNTITSDASHLNSANTKSCGCLNKDKIVSRNKDPLLIAKRKGKGYKVYRHTHWKTNEDIMCRGSYESTVVEFLNNKRIDYKWQIPFILENFTYIVDLYLPGFNKYIEIKGYWWSDSYLKFRSAVINYPDCNFWIWNKHMISRFKRELYD